MTPIQMPVRRVAEWILRCGDIDSRFVEGDVMLAGADAHRRLQAAMGEGYRREVALSRPVEAGGLPAVLSGRADGIFYENGLAVIDEIKTTTLPLELLARQRAMFLGQAQCYAWMYLQTLTPRPERAGVQLTMFNLDTEELRRERHEYSFDELTGFVRQLLDGYAVWLRREQAWRETRDGSLEHAVFPFEKPRAGQQALMDAVADTMRDGGRLYIQAPTGIGKTLSTLYPATLSLRGEMEKIFYLTAKTPTRTVAEEALRLMGSTGARIKTVSLRAKARLCLSLPPPTDGEEPRPHCTPEHCPYARGHYDRVNAALLELLNTHDLMTPELVTDYAKSYRLCPHETMLDLASHADLVIGDYNHLFDPVAYLHRFFGGGEGGRYAFLIDEAHNLPDRVRDMYTAALRRSPIARAKRVLKDKNPAAALVRKTMGQVDRYLTDARRELELYEQPHQVERAHDPVLAMLAEQAAKALEGWLVSVRGQANALENELLELYFTLLHYLRVAGLYDDGFAAIQEIDGDFTVTLYCMDPSHIIGEKLALGRAAALFSATLTPLSYYRELLGGERDDALLELQSPFDPEHLTLAAHCGISTKYRDREQSLRSVADTIYQTVSPRAGGYMVFFPSFEYLRQVHAVFTALHPDAPTLVQGGRMREGERSAFLERFDGASGLLVGFCVMGGVFSEGIDLTGERLIGVVVVGVGLPKINLRQDLIRDYYDSSCGMGYEYAYVYPGMNKVLQAAGRVIRTETDRGVVVLIDSRFGTPAYERLYPLHWEHMRFIKSARELRTLLES